jgi:hypothetical protein
MGMPVLEWIPDRWKESENSARAASRAEHAAGKDDEQGIDRSPIRPARDTQNLD